MTFEKNLKTFNFNKETLELLVEDNLDRTEIITSMNQAGFSNELTIFLLEVASTFYNSIMLRLKLYVKQNKNMSDVKKGFSSFPEALSLVEHLYNIKEVSTEVEHIELDGITSMLEKDIINSESDEEVDPLDLFFKSHVKAEKGSKLSTKESYELFIKWYNNNYEEDEPDKKEFKNFLSDKIGKSSKNSWKNYVLIA
jgi:hypothetical protein|tara:strand:- start:5557 stop:6147 length:591 start_codon:yes stop_codon:yes gene_type:complete